MPILKGDDTRTLDTIVTENLTYRDIFEDGNLFIVDNYATLASNTTINQDGSINLIANNQIQDNRWDITQETKNVYIYTDATYISGSGMAAGLRPYGSNISGDYDAATVRVSEDPSTYGGQNITLSKIIDNDYLSLGLSLYLGRVSSQTYNVRFNKIKIIDLSIFTNQPTQQEMDKWLSMYILLKSVSPPY